MKTNKLEIPLSHWRQMFFELRKRGMGLRESGAFLLSRPNSKRVERFICFDDLDDSALDSGIIMFHANGFVRLWNICMDEGIRVVADVHTHPDDWTGQSWADKSHPMVAQAGHISLIIPDFAQGHGNSLKGVGVHEYLGSHKWKTYSSNETDLAVILL
jgi:proteasome lid subunit RPN8/RPN11